MGKAIRKERNQLQKEMGQFKHQLRIQLSKLGIVKDESEEESIEKTFAQFKQYFKNWVKERMALEQIIEE